MDVGALHVDGGDGVELELLLQELLAADYCTSAEIERSRRVAVQTGERVDRVLVQLGLVAEHELAATWARVLGRAYVAEVDPETVFLGGVDPDFLVRRRTAIMRSDEGPVCVLQDDPLDAETLELIRLALGTPVEPAIADAGLIEALLRAFSDPTVKDNAATNATVAADAVDVERLRDLASDVPVIQWVNGQISGAVAAGASDVHLEPGPSRLGVRWRIDGELHAAEPPPPSLAAAVVSRIKILARLDIAERRLPQDGRCSLTVRGRSVDLRVATGPTPSGEAVVLRVLDRQGTIPDLASLGYTTDALASVRRLVARPNGIVLVTGPTGSGKTTTLYAVLAALRSPTRKLISIEDPVEYELGGVTQIQAAPAIGLDFAWALRSILRHDPDIVMVGEIRDRETAEVAIEAALTGHLVLSTLHTNGAAASLSRLLEMGVPPYLLAASVAGIVAQRLVRCLCPSCAAPDPDAAAALGTRGTPLRAVGCAECRDGYRGRLAVAEVLEMDAVSRRLILESAGQDAIEAAARAAGMMPLATDARRKVEVGTTSLVEAMRVVGADALGRGR